VPAAPQVRLRFPLLALALLSLLAAIWGGWLRIGWSWPAIQRTLPLAHGPLMISGFLGALVALERAVALRKAWMYLAPGLAAAGGAGMLLGAPAPYPALLVLAGSLGLLLIFIVILRTHLAAYTASMALGAAAWFIGNLLWFLGWQLSIVVHWWIAFLVLTVAGERLELGRLVRLPRMAAQLFMLTVLLAYTGLIAAAWIPALGVRLTGSAWLILGTWLLRWDISRRTIRQTGLPRFAAACLLSGYVWLAAGGVLQIIYGPVASGLYYDAVLHTILVGFIISMIFGHAPIIFPSVLGLPIRFTPWFYSHLVLLHFSLLLRISGDLLLNGALRRWGGLLNGIALLLFLTLTAGTILSARRDRNASRHPAA
jgi:hypothetical protein